MANLKARFLFAEQSRVTLGTFWKVLVPNFPQNQVVLKIISHEYQARIGDEESLMAANDSFLYCLSG